MPPCGALAKRHDPRNGHRDEKIPEHAHDLPGFNASQDLIVSSGSNVSFLLMIADLTSYF
jgi:hypothetical protein